MAGPRRPIGELLMHAGLITPQQLQTALAIQKSSGLRLGEVLVGLGYVTEADVARALAEQLQIPFVPDHEIQPDPQVVQLVPLHVARRKAVLPLAERYGHLVLAMADPLDVFTLDEVRFLTGRTVEPVAVTRSGLERVLNHWERLTALRRRDERDATAIALPPEVDAAPVIALVNQLIDQALEEQASDIHIEPGESEFRVRFRVDGFLREVMTSPMTHHPPVLARIKVMAGLDIAERRLPQDGRIEWRQRGRQVDLRVSTLPTIHGEKAVLRIFDKSRSIPPLAEIGFHPDDLARYLAILQRPTGMVLVTGPTGSGKTTTLLATVAHLAAPDRNIVTVEDPVEYQLPGINQVQVNTRSGLGFADGLRAILRQDPDIIMVGEIRDTETADTAVRAALTGHLVLSTLHTNDAPGALTRLIEMGVEPYLIASSVRAVVAQRLVRRLCVHCRSPATLDPGVLGRLAPHAAGPRPIFRAAGCTHCRGTGYSGRLAIFELMAVSPAIRDLVLRRRPAAEIRAVAEAEGMRGLLERGLEKVWEGLTTVEEVLRVIPPSD